jgi:ribonuclease D
MPFKSDMDSNKAAEADMQRQEASEALPVSGLSDVEVPPNQCWGQVKIVPKATHKTQQLVTAQAHTRYKVSQARLRKQQLPVVVKDAGQTFLVEQPQFVPVTESVKVQEEFVRLHVKPAVYETREEDVLIESARVGLRTCAAAGAGLNKAAGPQPTAQCAYEIPARYQKVAIRQLITPETVQEEVVPAVFKTITRMALAEPAKVVPVEIPVQTVQMPFASVDTPPSATPEQVQATTRDLQVTEYEKKLPQLGWSRVVCQSELTPALVHALQKGLQREGWMPGALDGKLGARTLQAVKDFQKQKGIESSHIAYQALEWLEVLKDKD